MIKNTIYNINIIIRILDHIHVELSIICFVFAGAWWRLLFKSQHVARAGPTVERHLTADGSDGPTHLFNLLAPELFFLILAHSVYKMWIIQEPNKLELWNKLHFKEKNRRVYTMFKIFGTYIFWINI